VAEALPTKSTLDLASPNPFRGSSTLNFALAARGRVELAIYSVDGRRVRTLVRGERGPPTMPAVDCRNCNET
jgi:hypothetical protein